MVGYIALFCFVVGGTAIAGEQSHKKAKRNSVVSSSIANGAVKTNDLHADAVDGSKVADGSLSAADVDLGPAGGDLTGSYPDPTLRPGAVDGGPAGDIADATITGDDVNPAASLRFEQAITGGGRSVQIDSEGLRGDINSGHFGAGWRLNTEGLDVAAGPAIGNATYGPGRITFGEADSSAPPNQSNEVALLARDEGDGVELVAVFGDGTEVVLASDASP